MKKKGFTLIELLVVIAIIALLMGILLPALAMVKKMAYRALCGTNLSGLYKALTTYAESYKDDYPKAGGKTALSPVVYWQQTVNWAAPSEDAAFMTNPSNPRGLRRASIGASLYLLIKYVDVGPRSFICRGDSAAVIFNLYDYSGDPDFANLGENMRNAWDFGTRTANTNGIPPAPHYSYCYQIPYGPAATAYYAPNPSRQPDLAIMADRSPYMTINPDPQALLYSYNPDDPGNEEVEQWGNSENHAREGQNVLFNNGGVIFSKVPYCGINNDNIYTRDTIPGLQQLGSLPTGTRCYNPSSDPLAGFFPQNGDDSLLVNEGLNQGGVQ